MEKIPSIKELRIAIQPDPKKETVWYAKYVIRKISIYLTWLLLHTSLTANQATILQALFGISGSLVLSLGGRHWSILAIFLLQLGYIFDCVDGEIARYRKNPTINGIFLDSLNHAIVIPIMFLGLAIYSYYLLGYTWILFVGILLGLVSANPIKKGMLSTLFYMLERKDNPKYKYENLNQEIKEPTSENRTPEKINTTKKSFRQIIYLLAKDISEYPTSLNIISVIIMIDFFIFKFTSWDIYPLPVILTVFYTIFLIGKEGFFFYKIYRQKIIEKKFLKFISS